MILARSIACDRGVSNVSFGELDPFYLWFPMVDGHSESTGLLSSLSGRMLRDVTLTVLVAILVGYGWHFLQFDTPNERARVFLTVAMVDHGDVRVDKPVERWGDVYDLSRHQGHWYCNKPPGSSLLGAALYAPLRWVAPDAEWSDKGLLLLMRFGIMLPLSLLGFVAIRRWLRMLDLSEATVDLASLAWILGSAAFHYAGAFFSHQIVAVCFVVAGYIIEWTRRACQPLEDDSTDAPHDETSTPSEPDSTESPDASSSPPTWRASLAMLGAGLALGLAGATEYQAGITCLFFAIYVVAMPSLRDLRLIVPFGLGAGLFVAILLVYHDMAFGGPFQLSYFYHRGGGVAPTGLPHWEYTKGVLFSPHRGLLITNPWMALVVPGAWLLFRRGEVWRGLAVLLFAGFAFRFGFLLGYKNWHGSWSFGLRHLVPQMGLMTVLCAVAIESWLDSAIGSWLVRGSIIAGVTYNQVMDAFNAVVPETTTNPLLDMVFRMYQEGMPSPNVVQVLTPLEGLTTLVPLAVLVAGTIVFIMLRGLGRLSGRLRQTAIAALALLPTVVLGVWLYSLGHDWSQKARDDWSGWIRNWHDKDRAFHGLDEDKS